MIELMFALLLSALPEGHAPVDPHSYVQGGEGDSVGDWSSAFEAMIKACSPQGERYRDYRGCKIVLACDYIYNLSRPLVLKRAHFIQGCGSGGNWGNTVLRWTKPTDGLIVEGPITLRDVHLMGSGTSTLTTAIYMRAGAVIKDVMITDFGKGVHIYGSTVPGELPGNANGWYVENLKLPRNRNWAFYVHGKDSNAGNAVGLQVANTCMHMREGEECWGIRDDSFIGNTYIGPHTAYSFTERRPKVFFPNYISNGPNVWVGPYQESETGGSLMYGWGLTLGGNIQNLGSKSYTQIKRNTRGTIFIPDPTSGGNLVFNEGGALRLMPPGGVDFRFVYDEITKTYGWRARGSGRGELAVTDHTSTDWFGQSLRPNRAWLGRTDGAYYVGPVTQPVAVVWGDAENPNELYPKCQDFSTGSVYRSLRPVEPKAWVCVCADGSKPTSKGSCDVGSKTWR